MSNSEISNSMYSCIKKFTSITPGIYFLKKPSRIMVIWEKNIPDKNAILDIEEALKQFGTVLPNHKLKSNFVCFEITH